MANKALSSYAEGDIVLLPESGVYKEFYVAKHNYESGLNGAGRTLLVREITDQQVAWNTPDNNQYAASDVDRWLNNTYKKELPASLQTSMATTWFYYTPGGPNKYVDTISRSVFLLSWTEYGLNKKPASGDANEEGTALSVGPAILARNVSDGTTLEWVWTRSPSINHYAFSIAARTFGTEENTSVPVYLNIAFTLPSTTLFDDSNKYADAGSGGEETVIEKVPTQNGSLIYNGSMQSPSWNDYDSAQLTIGGTTSGVYAGTYNATFTPKTGYKWSDGSKAAKTVPWSIGEASGGEGGGSHRTLVAGTGYDITGGIPLVGGTAYAVLKGRALIAGAGYDVSFEVPATNSVFHLDNGKTFEFEDGMTWEQFVNSAYNTGEFEVYRYTNTIMYDYYYVSIDGRTEIKKTEAIIAGQTYKLF